MIPLTANHMILPNRIVLNDSGQIKIRIVHQNR